MLRKAALPHWLARHVEVNGYNLRASSGVCTQTGEVPHPEKRPCCSYRRHALRCCVRVIRTTCLQRRASTYLVIVHSITITFDHGLNEVSRDLPAACFCMVLKLLYLSKAQASQARTTSQIQLPRRASSFIGVIKAALLLTPG